MILSQQELHRMLILSVLVNIVMSGLDELELLRDYARVFGKGTKYYFYIFSKGGFTEGLLQAAQRGEVTLVTLADLYN